MIASRGLRTFSIIWFGQFASLIGTAMTRFALMIWAYEQTGEATTLALLGFFAFIFQIVLGPIAGVLVDRLDRRLMMLLADLGSGLMTLAMLLLYAAGDLQIWHLYVAEALTGAFESFQIPAYSAATTMLVPKKHYTRASGMRSLALDSSRVIAPFAAGTLLLVVDIDGIMLIDVITFLIAMFTLLIVRIPRPPVSTDSLIAHGWWQQLRSGFVYIMQRPGLRGLMYIFVGIHFFAALAYFSILPAMILARTGNDQIALATVQSALGIGGVVGGLLLSVWGGPRRLIHAICAGTALSYLLGDFLFAVGQSVEMWVIAALGAAVFIPFISGANRAIWQAKTPPDLQGRVFSAQAMLQSTAMALGYLVAGPLADRVLEPAMQPGGALVPLLGGLVGTGPGAGMAVIFIITATFGALISLSGYLSPALRNVETELPDHELALAGD
ncbi:MAG: MFS transporter [Anaerolineaceae bacterium]|nr:MFS transporter [Anaerolineaceae bacterium]